jgi:hypothetical protein
MVYQGTDAMFQYGKQVSDPQTISPGIYVESLLSGLEI